MVLGRDNVWRHDAPSYDRTWAEIEAVLEQAITEMKAQRTKYMLKNDGLPGPDEISTGERHRRRCDGPLGFVVKHHRWMRALVIEA